jgi:hypothetical protein
MFFSFNQDWLGLVSKNVQGVKVSGFPGVANIVQNESQINFY